MNFFNNLYYGKNNRADFTPENLPANRVALYFDMLRVRWSGLINVNILFLIPMLPAIFWMFLNVMAMFSVMSTVPEGPDQAQQLIQLLSQFLIGMIPCAIPIGPGVCGLTAVTRAWARDEHAWVLSDFWQGVKDNWKQGMAVSVLDAVLAYVMLVAISFYNQMAATNLFFFFLQVFMLLLMIIFMMANLYIFPLMVTYKLTFSQLWRNAVLLTLARLPWSVLWLAFMLLPMALMLAIPSGIAQMVVIGLYALILFAFQAFTINSYTNATFDKYINPHLAGVEINRGMRKPEDDYDDDDEDEEEGGDDDALSESVWDAFGGEDVGDDEDDDEDSGKKRK